jgi:hypothetical protein
VNPETGSIKLNFPDLEVWEMEVTCALDVSERGGITLEEVGEILNLTRERIRQVEVKGLAEAARGRFELGLEDFLSFIEQQHLHRLTQPVTAGCNGIPAPCRTPGAARSSPSPTRRASSTSPVGSRPWVSSC